MSTAHVAQRGTLSAFLPSDLVTSPISNPTLFPPASLVVTASGGPGQVGGRGGLRDWGQEAHSSGRQELAVSHTFCMLLPQSLWIRLRIDSAAEKLYPRC